MAEDYYVLEERVVSSPASSGSAGFLHFTVDRVVPVDTLANELERAGTEAEERGRENPQVDTIILVETLAGKPVDGRFYPAGN